MNNTKHPIFETDLVIEGASVVYVFEGRIPKEQRHEHLHYYAMRHDDTDWSEPVSIEIGVLANFFGMIVTSSPILSLTPKPTDSEGKWYRIPIHPDEEPSNAYIQNGIMEILY